MLVHSFGSASPGKHGGTKTPRTRAREPGRWRKESGTVSTDLISCSHDLENSHKDSPTTGPPSPNSSTIGTKLLVHGAFGGHFRFKL